MHTAEVEKGHIEIHGGHQMFKSLACSLPFNTILSLPNTRIPAALGRLVCSSVKVRRGSHSVSFQTSSRSLDTLPENIAFSVRKCEATKPLSPSTPMADARQPRRI
jgi:hypothetical protein